jgi:branched-subunit amino acid transport protein
VLSAFVVPLVLAPEGRLYLSLGNELLMATVLTLPVAILSKSLIATVVAGSVIMAVIRLLG